MSTISDEYKERLQQMHNSRWGSSGAKYSGTRLLEVLRARPYIRTVLDFGAGKGTLGKFIREKLPEIEWTDYDPGISHIDALPSGTFDCVVSSDVLEHIEPDRLEEVLGLLARKTKYVLVSDIACYTTGKIFGSGKYKGRDEHLIVEDPSWWRDQFRQQTDLTEFLWEHREVRNKGRTKTRCFMVHER